MIVVCLFWLLIRSSCFLCCSNISCVSCLQGQHNCATTSTPSLLAVCCVFAAFPLPLAAQTSSIPPRFNVTVGCCVVCPHDQPPPVNQLQLNMLMCCPLLLFLLIICSNAVPSTFCVRTQVDCYVIEVLQQLHLPPCTSFVHRVRGGAQTCAEPSDHFNGSDG